MLHFFLLITKTRSATAAIARIAFPCQLPEPTWYKIKTHVREIRAAVRNPGGAGKAALILLTIVVALALLYLVAALSCSIACSGAEGLAFTVALLGTGGVVFLTVVVIRRILHRRRRDPEPEVMLD